MMPDANRAVPQLCPVRQVQLIAFASFASIFLARIFFIADFIKHTIRIFHPREDESQWADDEWFLDDLILAANAREQTLTTTQQFGARQ
jgi:hypothetical protein